MYTQNHGYNGAGNIAALAGDPNAFGRIPGMELTEEQKEISRKDREKLARLLQFIMIAQVVGIIANILVGVGGVMYYYSDEGDLDMPFFVGSFICGGALILSIFGAFNLRNMALNFVPEKQQIACCYLLLFEIPALIIMAGSMLTVSFTVTSSAFADKCDEDSSPFSSSFSDCTSNPDAEEYRTVAIAALALVAYNVGLAIATGAVMCTSPKAFVANQVDFNRPLVQTRHQQEQTMMLQQQVILQQQLMMQQQVQNQQMGLQQPPPRYPPPY